MSDKSYAYTVAKDDHPAVSPEFLKAKEDSLKLDLQPRQKGANSQDAIWSIKLYALYKQGNEGLNADEFQKVPRPGMGSSLTGKWQMYEGWREEVKAGTTAEQAQKQYIELVQEIAKERGITL